MKLSYPKKCFKEIALTSLPNKTSFNYSAPIISVYERTKYFGFVKKQIYNYKVNKIFIFLQKNRHRLQL